MDRNDDDKNSDFVRGCFYFYWCLSRQGWYAYFGCGGCGGDDDGFTLIGVAMVIVVVRWF